MSDLHKYLDLERLFGLDFIPSGETPKPATVDSPKDWPEEIRREFAEFKQAVLQCMNCGLCKDRTKVVFGVGNLNSPIVFVGEGPGEEEDKQGIPFVGRAGQLLTRTMEKVGVKRDQVYIANVVKCRPPQNRVPTPDEVRACMPLLLKQIQYIKPKVVCALGATAARALLNNPKIAIMSQRGRYVDYNNMKVFLTVHPSYCLRNPPDTYMLEDDLRHVFKDVGLIA
jgi:DNA polymerase